MPFVTVKEPKNRTHLLDLMPLFLEGSSHQSHATGLGIIGNKSFESAALIMNGLVVYVACLVNAIVQM